MPFPPEIEAQIAKNNERVEAQQWEQQPVDIFSDMLEIHEDHGVARLSFRVSRPDIADPLGGVTVVVARISIPWQLFDGAVRPFQKKMAVFDAGADADTRT